MYSGPISDDCGVLHYTYDKIFTMKIKIKIFFLNKNGKEISLRPLRWKSLNESNLKIYIKKIRQYLVSARPNPTKEEPNPKVFAMRVFARNHVVAKSRFW